jgi:3'(2'), 5'-bisphosphate nucleotidase
MIHLSTDLRETVIAIAIEAGQAIMSVYAGEIEVSTKDDASPLTQADLAAHRVIENGLQKLSPDIPILSEESASLPWEVRRHWTSYWLVDPLDGTREFIRRNDEFSVNIALIHHGVAVFGVVHAPVGRQTWHALRGEHAYRREVTHDHVLRVCSPPPRPLRVAASRSHRDGRIDALLERIGEVEVLTLGSALKFCRIAEGEVDVYPRLGPTSEWDTAAGQCVLHSAGGVLLSTQSGKSFRYNRRQTLLNGDFIALGDPALPWRDWLG